MWKEAQKWERDWHGTCANKVAGEYHQVSFIAPRMGLERVQGTSQFLFDLEGKQVLDIGGGAASLLLKCMNVKGKVVDPLHFPDWVYARYDCAGIEWDRKKGEDVNENGYDEVWIYNCLQHTENPKKVIDAARQAAKLLRIYEYVDVPVCSGHIHTLREADLNRWLGGEGKREDKHRYYGVFPSNVNTGIYWDRIHRREGKNTWRVKDMLNDYVLDKIVGSVLELGCGVGVLARRIAGEYVGLDVSQEAVRIMREQGFNARVQTVPPIGISADTIIGLEFLEHLDEGDRLATIKEASMNSKRAIFSVPDNCMPPEDIIEHRVMYNMDSFASFLSQAFQDVHIEMVEDKGTGYLVGVCSCPQ